MMGLERLIVDFLLIFTTPDALNAALRDPQTVAVLVGALIAICGALLGAFLLLRGLTLTSDAISHTVLLGIVVSFLVLLALEGSAPALSSPWLILGAAAAGLSTTLLTELVQRSGLVKQDAALGLVFPLLFAIAVLLISRNVQNVHLDTDAVLAGEVGMAWANTEAICLDGCETVTITPDDPRAVIQRTCSNCRELGIDARDARAVFNETCANCGTFAPSEAWSLGLLQEQPSVVFFPRSLGVMGVLALLVIGFVLLFYKELKLATFDAALAAALGLRPGLLNVALMALVSLVAVGAFDAVGSILMVAFFVLPPAAAYLLTDRLSGLLLIGTALGAAGAWLGYDLARGSLLGLVQLGTWNTSISASVVLVLFGFFVLAWIASPRYGLVATLLRRRSNRQRFAEQVLLGHVYNHEGTASAARELASDTLHLHFKWSAGRMAWHLARLRARQVVQLRDGQVHLTERGRRMVEDFQREHLSLETG